MIPKAKLILGPPGCGKTYRLIEEIRGALDRGTSPSRIGVISFTRKAIEEMVSRACAEFQLEPKDFPFMRTSHSFGFRGLGLQVTDIMNKEDYDNVGRDVGLTFEGKMSNVLDDGLAMPSIGGSGADYLQMVGRARLRMVTWIRSTTKLLIDPFITLSWCNCTIRLRSTNEPQTSSTM